MRRQNPSRRELEVGELFIAQKTTSEIAKELHLSEKTVQTHIAKLSEKTGSSDQEGLIGWLSSWFQ